MLYGVKRNAGVLLPAILPYFCVIVLTHQETVLTELGLRVVPPDLHTRTKF